MANHELAGLVQGSAVGDFNGDGKPDLALATSQYGQVSIRLGQGDGTFIAQPVSFTAGLGPISLGVADFNLDGKPDLAVVNTSDDVAGLNILTNTTP